MVDLGLILRGYSNNGMSNDTVKLLFRHLPIIPDPMIELMKLAIGH